MVVVVAVVSGCIGAAASKLVIPPARAQHVQRWEYLCLEAPGLTAAGVSDGFVKVANKAGGEGWDYIEMIGDSHCFKRALP
jgi:hypothetical protein